MRQLLEEYCHECLLAICEMVQFKNRVFRKALTQKQRRMMSQSMRAQKTKHFLKIPHECPRSDIVNDGECNDYKSMATELYLKYVKIGAVYEINVEWNTRRDLTDLIETNRWSVNEEYDDPLKL